MKSYIFFVVLFAYVYAESKSESKAQSSDKSRRVPTPSKLSGAQFDQLDDHRTHSGISGQGIQDHNQLISGRPQFSTIPHTSFPVGLRPHQTIGQGSFGHRGIPNQPFVGNQHPLFNTNQFNPYQGAIIYFPGIGYGILANPNLLGLGGQGFRGHGLGGLSIQSHGLRPQGFGISGFQGLDRGSGIIAGNRGHQAGTGFHNRQFSTGLGTTQQEFISPSQNPDLPDLSLFDSRATPNGHNFGDRTLTSNPIFTRDNSGRN